MPNARKPEKSLSFWSPDTPYNELPTLPPGVELETKAVLKSCIEARAALAELKQAAELIPNQGVLINTLPLLEAQASSEIENIVTTTDQLFQFREVDDKVLVKIGILSERTFGREKLFIHPKLMALLTRDSNDWLPYT